MNDMTRSEQGDEVPARTDLHRPQSDAELGSHFPATAPENSVFRTSALTPRSPPDGRVATTISTSGPIQAISDALDVFQIKKGETQLARWVRTIQGKQVSSPVLIVRPWEGIDPFRSTIL